MNTTKPEIKITVRIPAAVAEALRQVAAQHDRSLNGEIVRALREYTETHKRDK
ncbi:MAG: Arc family DNA-binding protein [Candidatus Angelobacter sp.]